MFKLNQIDPNPFNRVTKIHFSVEKAGPVDLAVFDVSGICVRTLFREERRAWHQVIIWNGRNDDGRRIAVVSQGNLWKSWTSPDTSIDKAVGIGVQSSGASEWTGAQGSVRGDGGGQG